MNVTPSTDRGPRARAVRSTASLRPLVAAVSEHAETLSSVHGTMSAMTTPGSEDPQNPQASPGEPGEVLDLESLRSQLEAAGAPPELMQALDGVTDPDQFLDVLSEAMPEQHVAATDVLAGFGELLKPETTPLEAELAAAEFLGMVRRAAPDVDMSRELLSDLMSTAEVSGQPHAMAMLRSVAAVAPAGVRDAANETAERLAATGVAEPAWVAELGSPEFNQAFGYRDDEQECIATVFSYDADSHALVTLIDHSMGGGLKDIFLTDQLDVLRREYERAAEAIDCDLVDHGREQAHQILNAALGQPPCAEQPDQVEDVRNYKDLLRRRVAVLAPA